MEKILTGVLIGTGIVVSVVVSTVGANVTKRTIRHIKSKQVRRIVTCK